MTIHHVFRIKLSTGQYFRNRVYLSQNIAHGVISQCRIRGAKVEAMKVTVEEEYAYVPKCDRPRLPRFY